MNLYLRELKSNRKNIIIWSIVMIFFILMGMQKYSSIALSGSAAMMDLISSMPKFLQSMFGLSLIDFTTPLGYFGLLYSYLALMAAIHSSSLGTNLILKEERDKTAEFLMTKPITRNKIITSKLLIGLTNIIIFNLVTFISSYFVLKTYTNGPILKEILLFMVGMLFIQIIFLLIGMCLACILKKPKKAGSISMIILVTTFFFSLMSDISDKLNFLKYFSPFEYFDAKDFLITENLNIYYIVLSLIICASLLIISYKQYKIRDLNL